MPFRTALVPSLLALACLGQAADLGWSGSPGTKAPPGWTTAVTGEATIGFLDRAIEINVPANRQALAVAAVDLPDGSDERPMRLSALVSVSGNGSVTGYPALVAVEWAGGAVFAVGLGDDPHSRRGDQRRAWAVWSGKGVAGTDHAEADLAAESSPAHLRIVLSSREVAAYGSRDGWNWSRVAGIAREQLGALGAPARVVVGRGLARSGAAGLAADPPGEGGKDRPCLYRFADLRVESGPADVPASTLRSYVKKDSLSDTTDALAAAGKPRRWRVRGPEDGRKAELPNVLPAGFVTGDGWKDQELAENARFLQLGKLTPGGGGLRWATTDLTTSEAGWVRLRFDSQRRCRLWVAGRLVAVTDRDVEEAELDRQSALVWLPAGTHPVVLGVRSNDERVTTTLRWESGDPLARIALLRRLAVDFTGDEQLIDAPFEIARLWEGLGFAREAAGALAEVVGAGDTELAERALAERARLYHQVRDEAAATAETAALQKLWESTASDPIGAARRTAQLWQRLDVPEQALAVLGEALKLPGLDVQTRCGLAVDRARLRRALGDEAGVANELRAAAELLPSSDPIRFDLLCTSVKLDQTAAKPALDALTKQAVDALRARQLAGMYAARKDESSRIAARRLAAGLPGTALALPAIEWAEDLAAAKDEVGALQAYQGELARRKLPAAKDLAAARAALVRSVLAERPAGAALLAEVSKISGNTPRPLTWKACGPHPLGDWSPHENPSFDLTKGAAAGPVAGKAWTDVPGDQWVGGILDLTRLGGTDSSVYYLTTVIDSDADRQATATFGADDALSLWVNGTRVYSDRTQRGVQPDSIAVSLPLRKGANVLVASIQNGGGGFGFQARMRREPWPATDIASAIAGGDRAQSAQALADAAATLAGSNRVDEAWALARSVIACFPDRSDLLRELATRSIAPPGWKLPPDGVVEVLGWFDAALADRRWDDNDTRARIMDLAPGLLVEAGMVDEALARLRRQALIELDPANVAAANLREADLWLSMGYPRKALAACQRARDAAPGDEAIDREADRRRRTIRAFNADLVQIASPFELATTLRTADRAMAGDPARAVADLQRAIESGRDQPIQLGDGTLRGVSAYATTRLRVAGTAAAEAWSERNDARAATALERAAASGDASALAAVAARWPLAPSANEALRRSADLWAAEGAWHLALGSAQQALATSGEQGGLLLRAAHAAARLGDAATLDAALARLAKLGQPLPWDGKEVPPDRLAAILRAFLPATVLPEPRPAGLVVKLPVYAPAMRPATLADARPPVPSVRLAGDVLLVATPDELAAIAPDGAVRWRLADVRLPTSVAPEVTGQGESSSLAVEGGLVVAGLRRSGSRRLVAVDLVGGHQRWTSAELPELADAALASAPTLSGGRVWAWFADRSRGMVVCLDARDGTVLWKSTLSGGPLRQPLTNAGDVIQGGDAPAPALNGRELFVSTDAGQIGAFDAADGRLLWLSTYLRTAADAGSARTALRQLMARGRGVVLADAARVYIAPRDTLGVIALDRTTGAAAWSAELADVNELSALTPAGLLATGSGMTMFDPATGQRRWRWKPPAGQRIGRPVVGQDAAWLATTAGTVRLNLADGSAKDGPAWSALGVAGGPATLLAAGDRLVAAADGIVAVLAPGPGKPVQAELRLRLDPISVAAAPAGDTKPVAVAVRWDLPLGNVDNLLVPPGAADGEAYVVAGGRLSRIDAANGRIIWSVPTASVRLRSLVVDGGALMALGEQLIAVHDRATGQLRWRESMDRDPAIVNWWSGQNFQGAVLDGERILLRGWRDNWCAVRSAVDGREIMRANVDGWVVGGGFVGEDLQLVIARGNTMTVEVRRLADGTRLHAAPVGLEDTDNASTFTLPGGDLVIANRTGVMLWQGSKRQGVRLDLGMRGVYAVWMDGERITVIGHNDHWGSVLYAGIDRAGKVLAKEEFAQVGEWQDALGSAPRWIGDLRVRPQNRNRQSGLAGWKADGGEAFWLAGREEWRRNYVGVVPLGRQVVAVCSDREGMLRAQLIDPQAGRLDVDSGLGASPASRVLPVAAGGGILVGTTKGLLSLIPVATPVEPLPGHALGEAVQPIWRPAKPLVVDGQLDEWEDQASWEQTTAQAVRDPATPAVPAGTFSAKAAWRDDAFLTAFSIPLPPDRLATTLLAVDAVRNGQELSPEIRPLMLALTWQGGIPAVRMVNALVAEDPTRPPIQARAAGDGTKLTWEVLIPWGWLYAGDDRPGRDRWLRWGVASRLDQPAGTGLEMGAGLFDGLDKPQLTRLHLVESKAAADSKPPEGGQRRKPKKP